MLDEVSFNCDSYSVWVRFLLSVFTAIWAHVIFQSVGMLSIEAKYGVCLVCWWFCGLVQCYLIPWYCFCLCFFCHGVSGLFFMFSPVSGWITGLANGQLIVFCHFSEVIVSPVDVCMIV